MKRIFTLDEVDMLIGHGKLKKPWVAGIWWLLIALLWHLVLLDAHAADTQKAIQSELSKPEIRGGLVFKNYCALCHGERGDGLARTSILHGSVNLRIKPGKPEKYEKIIREGGAVVGMSPFMPPWEKELSEEQIGDVVIYLKVINDSISRGQVVYKTNCILCHGINADGKGRAAKLFEPAPADLTVSNKNDDYKEMIIRLGGEAMGRSAVMPVWGEQLSDQEIKDVVAYLGTILVSK